MISYLYVLGNDHRNKSLKSESEVTAVVSDSATLWTVACPSSFVHGDSPGKNTGVDCHILFQGIFLAQGLNLHLLH